jgi:hypothetical protein
MSPSEGDRTRAGGHGPGPDQPEKGVTAPHDVDRAFGELLQEMRVAQTGGQIFFAFLFSVAFTPVMQRAPQDVRDVYVAALIVVVASTAFLVVPVAAHRWLFGRRARHSILIVSHVATMIGLALLAAGIVLGLYLIGLVLLSDEAATRIAVVAAGVLVVCWLVVPLAMRHVAERTAGSPDGPSGPPAGGSGGTPRPGAG